MPEGANMRTGRSGLARHLREFDRQNGCVIVCEERKFIFLKTAKAAGTSIFRRHLQSMPLDLIFKKEHPQRLANWLAKVTDRALEQYFIFTVVRNPWDRMVSVAGHFEIPFLEFIHRLPHYLEDEQIHMHSLPCHLSTHHRGGRFADGICRMECVQADYNLVCDQLGFQRIILPRANRTRHAHYSEYYSDVERLIVERAYAEDIRLHGYMFERIRNSAALPAAVPMNVSARAA
jgi:hypothetical protein